MKRVAFVLFVTGCGNAQPAPVGAPVPVEVPPTARVSAPPSIATAAPTGSHRAVSDKPDAVISIVPSSTPSVPQEGPSIRHGATQVTGKLAPEEKEEVLRIVRRNNDRFQLCYENGLRSDPSLKGRVTVKFVIDRNGYVVEASDAGSDLRDQGVISCIVRYFTNLSFPKPEGGQVVVVYPMLFRPSD